MNFLGNGKTKSNLNKCNESNSNEYTAKGECPEKQAHFLCRLSAPKLNSNIFSNSKTHRKLYKTIDSMYYSTGWIRFYDTIPFAAEKCKLRREIIYRQKRG